jgi:hypothetical protein
MLILRAIYLSLDRTLPLLPLPFLSPSQTVTRISTGAQYNTVFYIILKA